MLGRKTISPRPRDVQAGKASIEYRAKQVDLRAGVTFANDRLIDGTTATSTTGQIGGTRRLFSNRLELDAQTEFALDKTQSIDFSRGATGWAHALPSPATSR